MTAAFRNRAFRWIVAVLFADSLLEWFGSIALMALVYERSHSTTVAAAMLVCKQVAPAALVPLAAPTLERLGVGRGLTAAFTLQAVTLIAVALCGYGPMLFVLAIITGIAGTLVRSLLRLGFARTLEGEALRAGNAFSNIGIGVTGLVGPGLAALAVGAGGAQTALFGAGIAMVACAAFAMLIPAGVAADVVAGDDLDGVPTMGTKRSGPEAPLGWLLLLVGLMTCLGSMDEPTLLAYSDRALHAGVSGYGAIFMVWGAGMTIGGLAFTRLIRLPMLQVFGMSAVLISAAYLGMGVSPTLAATLALALIGGAGNGISWIALVSAVQEATPKGQEASASARLESMVSAGPGIGIVLGGIVADLASPRVSLLVPGVLVALMLIAGGTALQLRGARRPVRRQVTPVFSPSAQGGSV